MDNSNTTLDGFELGRLEYLARNGDHEARQALRSHRKEIAQQNVKTRNEEQVNRKKVFGQAGLDEARRRGFTT